MVQQLFSSDRRHFDLLARMAQLLVDGSAALVDLVEHFEQPGAIAERLRTLEHEADGVAHEVMTLLHKSPFTPIDRPDIAGLVQRMDDVLDYMEEAAAALVLYRVQRTRPRAVEAVRLLPEMTRLIADAVDLLSHGQLPAILALCERLHGLENRADTAFRAAMSELFDDEPNVAEVIKWREVYADLEAASDSAEAVAVVLEGIVLKYA
jgi:uncharacterized protein